MSVFRNKIHLFLVIFVVTTLFISLSCSRISSLTEMEDCCEPLEDSDATTEIETTVVPEEIIESMTPTPSPTVFTGSDLPLLTSTPVTELPQGTLTGNDLVLDLPLPPALPARDYTLESLINSIIDEAMLSGSTNNQAPSYSVAVLNLEDGRSAYINSQHIYNSASLFKLGLLLELHRQRDIGDLSFSHTMVIEEEHADHDYGTLSVLGYSVGDEINVHQAMRGMITISDTPTAIMMEELVGPSNVDDLYNLLELESTRYITGLPITAADVVVLLQAIAYGEMVSNESRLNMLHLLTQEGIRNGILSGVPSGTVVAHKTGNWANATHDVGLVWGPSGPYIIAILTNQGWKWDPIVNISEAVFEYFTSDEES